MRNSERIDQYQTKRAIQLRFHEVCVSLNNEFGIKTSKTFFEIEKMIQAPRCDDQGAAYLGVRCKSGCCMGTAPTRLDCILAFLTYFIEFWHAYARGSESHTLKRLVKLLGYFEAISSGRYPLEIAGSPKKGYRLKEVRKY